MKERFENRTSKEQKAVDKIVGEDRKRYEKERTEFNQKGYYTLPNGQLSKDLPVKKKKERNLTGLI